MSAHTKPTEQDCYDLLGELRLAPTQGCIGTTSKGFFVMIFAKVKRPAMIKYRGWSIEYHIGNGMPEAL